MQIQILSRGAFTQKKVLSTGEEGGNVIERLLEATADLGIIWNTLNKFVYCYTCNIHEVIDVEHCRKVILVL